MSQHDPQPPRPTQVQLDAAYRDGLFTCAIESIAGWRLPAELIPERRGAVWMRYRNKARIAMHPPLSARDVFGSMHFPWGRVPVREWTGWPATFWNEIARLTQCRPGSTDGHWLHDMRADWIEGERIGWDDPPRYTRVGGMERRLLDAGFWACERAVAYPDEAPLARAAWADPSCYAIYADWCDEQGHELVARALRRIVELAVKDGVKA